MKENMMTKKTVKRNKEAITAYYIMLYNQHLGEKRSLDWLMGWCKACVDGERRVLENLCKDVTSRYPHRLALAIASAVKWEYNRDVRDSELWSLEDWTYSLGKGTDTCPLCTRYNTSQSASKYCVKSCPLSKVGACCTSGTSPYDEACQSKDTSSIVVALEKAVKWVIKDMKKMRAKCGK